MKIVLPGQDVPIQNNLGIDPVWYEKLSALAAFANYFSEVNFNTISNGQVLVWDATLKKFIPGAN